VAVAAAEGRERTTKAAVTVLDRGATRTAGAAWSAATAAAAETAGTTGGPSNTSGG
jgi:hypothetical protein